MKLKTGGIINSIIQDVNLFKAFNLIKKEKPIFIVIIKSKIYLLKIAYTNNLQIAIGNVMNYIQRKLLIWRYQLL